MFIRMSKRTTSGRTYEYPQLVRSVRGPQGSPRHEVVAHLGGLSQVELANFRLALAAARSGKKLTIAEPGKTSPALLPTILDNYRFLDVAVLLETWRRWGLHELLEQILGTSVEAQVTAALAVQRCVAPGSKLYATEWFPRSALPELLGVSPESFNNSRIHRVLEELDTKSSALMSRLPSKVLAQDGAFVTFFLDSTDAWFVGHGPKLAEKGMTKEGLVKRKIGIVLLCNQHGFPLRWEVVGGARSDCRTFLDMMRGIALAPWAKDAPIVCDRAMGHTATLCDMAATGLRFLTAMTVHEFPTYAPNLPSGFAALKLTDDAKANCDLLAAEAERHHFQRAGTDLFVKDYGIIELAPAQKPRAATEPGKRRHRLPSEAMRLCRDLVGSCLSLSATARKLGMSKQVASQYAELRHLSDDLVARVLDREADDLSIAMLRSVARHRDADAQRAKLAAFQLHGKKVKTAPPKQSPSSTQIIEPSSAPLHVRVVAYFNPERFLDKRAVAARHVVEVEQFVAQLNESLSSVRSRMNQQRIAAAVDRKLRSLDLVDAFTTTIEAHELDGRTRFSVAIKLDDAEWARRRCYDGFTILVAHTAVTAEAVELCRIYRAKDVIEKDFHIIKSPVELRPVWHRTDPKVRAHVTICMLALLLTRAVGQRLNGALSAEKALETLSTCHLNRYSLGHDVTYTMTAPTKEQRQILRSLDLEALADEAQVAEKLLLRR
jgi:hypothetical protein